MESIQKIFKIGYGPSSSHTMGPRKAAEQFKAKHPNATRYTITLFGSLAATGKGHLTDKALIEYYHPTPVTIEWQPETFLERHPNAMKFEAFGPDQKQLGEWIAYSVGGGDIVDDNTNLEHKPIYSLHSMSEILKHTEDNGQNLWEYVLETEGDEIWAYLQTVWDIMKDSVIRGLDAEGTLPGSIHLGRKASAYHIKARSLSKGLKRRSLLFAYALAVAEENAAGNKVVTAPTCGSCGVLPGLLYLLQTEYNFSDQRILRALATAGLIGNLVKFNASISGAEVGCQGEIGTACAMASGAAIQLFGGTPSQVEYAAEMGLEHHLGLTCDPVGGYVQIPCIERNAFAAARALEANTYAMLSDGRHRVSFDKIVETMNQTGHDLPSLYKETSEGGLAIFACQKKNKK